MRGSTPGRTALTDDHTRIIQKIRGVPYEKQMLLDHPDLFIVRYFQDKIDRLEDFHLRLIETATGQQRGLILYPAQHGKTTLVSTLLPIWAVCRNPNIRIAIIAKNETEAEGIMRAIQAELMLNLDLRDDFGPFRTKEVERPWALGMLSITRRTARDKEQNITVFGSGAKTVLGHRTDWTICDDVVTQENSQTPEQRYKIKQWFDQSVSTGPVPGGRLTVVGTRFDPNDLYSDLMNLNEMAGQEIWKVQKEDAIVDEDAEQALWPRRMPYDMLMLKKLEIGTLAFNKRYRNRAVDESRMIFREEYVRGGILGKERYKGCIDHTYRIGEYEEEWKRVAGFDPAIGAQRQAKFCAHITLALGSCIDHDRCLWVVDLIRDQMSMQNQVETIITQHDRYKLWQTLIETNAYQHGLYEAVQRRCDEIGMAIDVKPHYTSRYNKPDPEIGVNALAPWFERGWVHIPWGDAHSRRIMGQLVDELVQYPSGRTTDTVMATWIAWRGVEEGRPVYESFNRLEKKPLAWGTGAPQGRRVLKNPFYASR